jgi:hypothetical protein
MPAASANGRTRGVAAQRCAVCDADVLFLVVCPACGSPTGNDGRTPPPPPAPPPVAWPPAGVDGGAKTGTMVSFADAARIRNGGALPDRLVQAWAPVPGTGMSPSASGDDFAVARRRRTTLVSSRSGLVVLGVVVVVALAAALGLQLAHLGRQPADGIPPQGSNPPAVSRYEAGGLPFTAAFPVAPTLSHERLSLLGLGYVASSYTAESSGTVLSVGVYPLPVGFGTPVPAATLVRNFLRLDGAEPSGTSVSAGAMTKIDGLDAAMLAGTADGGRVASFGALVLDGHVVYELLVTGPATTVDQTFGTFLARFRIVDPELGFTF